MTSLDQPHAVRDWEHIKSIDKVRNLFRADAPPAKSGLVIEDLDMVCRWYGPLSNGNHVGHFMLVEAKHGHACLNTAQARTFAPIHDFLTMSGVSNYKGFWRLNYDTDGGEKAKLLTLTEEFVRNGRIIEGHDAIMRVIRTGVL